MSVVAMALGVVTGASGAAAYAVSGSTFKPVAGGADFGGLPDPQATSSNVKIDTVHAVDLGGETVRLLRAEQLVAMETVTKAGDIARSGYEARQQAAAEQAAAEAEAAAEARKSPHQRQVEAWIKEAIAALQVTGTPITEDSVEAIYLVIEKESTGNPNAINTWDSNAMRGTPSKGLMQVIDPTFEAYKLPGYDDIFRPVDNIIAGVRYVYARYGGFDNHPGLVGISTGTGYQGY
ncbi:transglycosylase SLT domain-containing protein [Umezawaea beigongshangensis]|uniref:transglycosylase SLT domain-containing protein n=1 Tax=Umezawaea beigongshangensis TaxID=2780383 RepID=UPI0027DEA5B0|nr:transglycosylase SLT domain-containing protein [Umezawaea beigongshangensis]